MTATLITVLFTSIVGYGIISAWQRKNWLYQQKFADKKETFNLRYEVIADLSRLFSSRVHSTINYFETILSADLEKIENERAAYRKCVDEWNESFPSLVNKARSLFDAKSAYEFDRYAPPIFVDLDNKLRNMRQSVETGSEFRSDDINFCRYHIHLMQKYGPDFFGRLYKRADNERKFLENPPLNREHLDDLSLFYLIKCLFKSRSGM